MIVRRLWIIALLLFTFIALFFAVFPLWVMRPFRAQTPGALHLALQLSYWARLATACALSVVTVLVLSGWGRFSRLMRATGVLLLLVTAASAVLAHVNIFERMFHPRGTPQFVSIHDAHLDPDDMLLTVKLGDEAHAYPIRSMGYHHVVNDVINGVPIAATY